MSDWYEGPLADCLEYRLLEAENARLRRELQKLKDEQRAIRVHLGVLGHQIPETFDVIRAALRDKGYIE